MLKKTFILPVLLAASLTSAVAQDFSKGSKAKEWNLYGESKALFSGKIVDVLCELNGTDCPENCGNGNRLMGIVRSDDNKLILVMKNRQTSFNGAVEDLLPYCGKDVDVDGLLVGEDEVNPTQYYLVQNIRLAGEEKWKKANNWVKAWKKKNPDVKGKGPWFKRDPRVKAELAKTGYFGLGLEADAKYFAENED